MQGFWEMSILWNGNGNSITGFKTLVYTLCLWVTLVFMLGFKMSVLLLFIPFLWVQNWQEKCEILLRLLFNFTPCLSLAEVTPNGLEGSGSGSAEEHPEGEATTAQWFPHSWGGPASQISPQPHPKTHPWLSNAGFCSNDVCENNEWVGASTQVTPGGTRGSHQGCSHLPWKTIISLGCAMGGAPELSQVL